MPFGSASTTQYSLCSSGHGRLYEILRNAGEYFKLCCGQNEIRMRSAHGSYKNAAGGPYYDPGPPTTLKQIMQFLLVLP